MDQMNKEIEKLREDFILKWIYQPTGIKKANDFQLIDITTRRNEACDDLNALIQQAKLEQELKLAAEHMLVRSESIKLAKIVGRREGVKEEQERCAKIAENYYKTIKYHPLDEDFPRLVNKDVGFIIAKAIRED